MVTVKATPQFTRLAKKILTAEALQEMVDKLTLHPDIGDVIPQTGGIRKIRWHTGKSNKGKSGGVRVLYYHDKSGVVVLLITLFKKSEKSNIDAGEKAYLKKILPTLMQECEHE